MWHRGPLRNGNWKLVQHKGRIWVLFQSAKLALSSLDIGGTIPSTITLLDMLALSRAANPERQQRQTLTFLFLHSLQATTTWWRFLCSGDFEPFDSLSSSLELFDADERTEDFVAELPGLGANSDMVGR